jgi:hypothetical protein
MVTRGAALEDHDTLYEFCKTPSFDNQPGTPASLLTTCVHSSPPSLPLTPSDHTPTHPTNADVHQALEDHDTLYELCETWQQLEQQRWTAAELQRRRARLALDYPGDAGEEEIFGEQVSMIYGATTNKPGYKVGGGSCVWCLRQVPLGTAEGHKEGEVMFQKQVAMFNGATANKLGYKMGDVALTWCHRWCVHGLTSDLHSPPPPQENKQPNTVLPAPFASRCPLLTSSVE